MNKNIPVKSVSLADQLWVTSQVILQVGDGQSLDQVLPDVESVLRPGVQALSYHVLRHWGLAQVLAQSLVEKTPPQQVQALLWVALALCATQESEQAVHADEENGEPGKRYAQHPSYKPYVLVSQTVEAAKLHFQTRSFAPLVNGVLRRFLREKEELLANSIAKSNLAKWNFPAWWVGRVQADWPHAWPHILHTSQLAAPLTLRVNATWATPEQAVAYLRTQNMEAKVVGPYAVELQTPKGVEDIPGFAQGYFSVQAAAAQLAAPLLLDALWVAQRQADLGRPLRVLDACAAPGGKTAHMLEIAPKGSIEVLALDSDAHRLDKVEETLLRIKGKAQLCQADAGDVQTWCGADEYFDAILLDAPCTASGIVRRHPDIRWLRRKSDVQDLAAQQQRLLEALWTRLLPGGRLLYCTCSVFKAEGEDNAQEFDLRHNDAHRLPAPGHIEPVLLHAATQEGHTFVELQAADAKSAFVATDGFYYALFEK